MTFIYVKGMPLQPILMENVCLPLCMIVMNAGDMKLVPTHLLKAGGKNSVMILIKNEVLNSDFSTEKKI